MLSKCFAVIILLSHQVTVIFTQTLMITNNPMDTTVCTGSTANISCGFVNDSRNFVPNWRIIRRSSDGSVISNMTISGVDIISNANDGLEWIPDTNSGLLMSPNSRLEVGPVNETHNQSSYQCIFAVAGDNVESSVGTLTVVTGSPPSPINDFNVREMCDTIISGVSWTSNGDPVCGPVSHELTISPTDQMIMIMRITNTSYDITGLTPDTSYNLTVNSSNNAGSVESVMMIRTLNTNDIVPRSITNITITTNSEETITVTWDAASSPYCGGILYYMVMISSDRTNNTISVTEPTATFTDLMNDTNYTVTVTPYNRVVAGMSTTVTIRTCSPIPTQSNNNGSDTDITRNNTDGTCDSESDNELSTGVVVTIIIVPSIIALVVTALISIIITSLYYNHRYELKEKKVKVKHTNESIPMDTNPAYGTTATIKIDANPAYGTTATIKMDTNPAYATTT